MDGADDAYGDADDHGDQDAEDHDQDGGLQAVEDVLHHRQVVVQGGPQVPVEDALDVVPELDQLGLIEAQGLPQDLQIARRGVVAQDLHRHVAGQHPHQEEGDEHHDEEHRDGGKDALDDKFEHGFPSSLADGGAGRPPPNREAGKAHCLPCFR